MARKGESELNGANGGSGSEPRELTDADRAKLVELTESIEKFTAQKRWSDVIKATLQKAELLVDPAEKVELFSEAGRMYLERSSNQGEAIKCFQRVLDLDPTNVQAITQLKEMYEKRRDWERLVEVMRAECALLDPADQPLRRLEIAKMATEKRSKPNVCIELWQDVLTADPGNAEALNSLAGLYERAREWAPLAEVLERQGELAATPADRIAVLQKLGNVYSDKLQNDAGALQAYQRLLELDPNDRRAQEQLKKRWIATGAWDELEQFYTQTDKLDELIRTLERAADTSTSEVAERIALQFRIARLWQEKKQAPDRAARAYEKVLVLDANDLQAAEALSPLYEQAGDSKKLAGVYEVRLKHVDDPDTRIALLREVGLLYEEKLRSPQQAFERILEAFSFEAKNEVLREDVNRLAAKVNGWDAVFQTYDNAVRHATHPDDANDLRLHYGEALHKLNRVAEAIAQYKAVYEDRSDDARAIAALEQLYRESGDYRGLLGVLSRRAEYESDPELRKRLAYDMAELYRDHLGEPAQAIEAFKNIPMEFGEGEVEAYRALDSLYESEKRFDDLARTLEHRIDIGPESTEELSDLKFRLAGVLHKHLNDSTRAIELYREVLTLMPEHEGAMASLEAMLSDSQLGGSASAILVDVYEARADFAKLVRALEVSAQFAPTAEERVELITRIAEVRASRLGDQSGAFTAYAQAFEADPDNPEILTRLEAIAAGQSRIAEMVKLIEARAKKVDDPLLQRRLYLRAAQIHDADIGDVEAAVAAYTRALALDESDEEILGALEALYRRTERWTDLLEILQRKTGITSDPAEQEQLLAQMAFIQDEMLSDPQAAIRLHAQILELDPTSKTALTALDGLYERQAMWSDLADNVGRQLSLTDDAEQQLVLMLRLGTLRETRMSAPEAAIEIYREILERDPDNAQALAALERLLARPEYQSQIAEILEPLYRDKNEYAKLISIHDIQVQNSTSSDQRVELLHRMAELYEVALEDLGNAFHTFARALAEDPANSSTREQLDRIASTASAWQELAEVYEAEVQRSEDPAVKALLHARSAQIREEYLGDTQGAIAHHQQVLAADSGNLDSASALERLYQVAERYDELAKTYLTKASLLPAPDEKRDYLFRAGALYEEVLDQPEAAIDVYRRVLRVEAEDVGALDKLIQLHLRLSQWEKLLEAYGQKADVVADADQKKSLYAQVGAVYEQKLSQPEKAIETYQRVLDLDPEDLTALGRLDALFLAAGRSEELLTILEREAELSGDALQAIDLRYRIGELYEQKLNDAFRAVETYRDILDHVPDHAATLAALERMIAAGREAVAAAAVLEPIYRAAGDSARLAQALEVLIEHEEDPPRKVELLHQVAEIYEVHLDEPQRAFDALARAFPVDSQHDATLASLERLAEKLSAFSRLTELYDAGVKRLRESSPETTVDLALRAAQLFEVQLGDVNAAIARYQVVCEIDPTHIAALEALDRLYEATERWAELAQVLERKSEVASSPDEILAIQFKTGQLAEHRLNDLERAVRYYRDILAAAPEHEPALKALEALFARGVLPGVISEILEPLYRMQEAWDRLIGVHEVALRVEADPNERVQMMQRIAEIAEERAGDKASALTWMLRALLEDSDNDHTVGEVERLAADTGNWLVLADTYATISERAKDNALRVSSGKRLARVYEEELSDIARAEETYRYVVALDPKDEDVLAALDRIYTEHAAAEALAEILRKRMAAADSPRLQVEFAHRLGQVLWNECRRTDDAIAVFRQILDSLDPQHEDTLHALQNIYTVTKAWSELFKVYERELDIVVGDGAQAETLGRMATLAATELNDFPRAVELLRRVLDLLGEDPQALNALGNIYALQENWTDLVDVLEREVAIASDDEMRMRIYADLGRIWYEKLHRDRNALSSWELVLDVDPSNAEALGAIAAIHRAAGSNQELVETLHRTVDAAAEKLTPRALEGVYMELGALYGQRLKQPADAVEAYNKALEINPGNFGALDALEAIHSANEDWVACIEVKQRRVSALSEARDKIVVLLDIAAMWNEKLEDPNRAIEPLNQILEVDPMHHFAFERLEQAFRDSQRYEDLVALYLTRVEANSDAVQRVHLLRNVARVYEKDLDDKLQAFDALLIAWTQDFTNEDSARELERMAGLTQRWNELLTTANQSLSELDASETEIRNAICLKCARWYGREGHPEYAVPYLQQVLAIDPVNRGAMRQMAELYRQTQQWPIYAQALTKLVDMTEDPAERADVYVSMGELKEEQFKQADQAIAHYRDALDAVSTHLGAIRALERIYRAREQWAELVEILRRKIGALSEPEHVLAAKLELAEAYEDRVVDRAKATEQYKKVLEDDARNLAALKGLERLYAQQEQWQSLLDVLERQLEVVQNERDQIALSVRIAGMWEEEFLKPEKAAERLERVLEIDPTHIQAYTGLERIYRNLRKWPELVNTYERHVDATPDRGEKAEIHERIGGVYRDEIKDVDRAIDSFLNVTGLEAGNQPALRALAALYEARGDHGLALDVMEKLSGLASDQAERVALLFRMGKLLDKEMGDRVAAVEQFHKAIELDERHLPSLEAMRAIHVEGEDFLAAARVLERIVEVESAGRRGAQYRVELGRLYEDKLEEHEKAVESFEAARALDPDNAEAALPLVHEYAAKGRWKDAEPLLQMLVRSAAVRESDQQQKLWRLYGQTAEQLNDDETATKAYGKAFELDAQDLVSLKGLAAAYYRSKEWDNAFKYYQMVLVHHRDELSSSETTDTCYRLGIVKREQGERAKALNMFEKALEEDGYHRPTLEALVESYTAAKDFEQVIHYKKRVLEVVDDKELRFDLTEEIGDLWNEKLKNPAKAIESYVEASEIKPQNHKLLHKLLALYQSTGQWAQAIEIIDRVSDLDQRGEAKAKYAYTVGVILRDELKDAAQALGRFNAALDLDPAGMLKAFEAINKLLTQQKDWRELERAFRKMLHRVSGKGDTALEFNLWHNLGVIYRDRQRNLEAAAEAFAMASRLQPENMLEHQILAEIFAMVPTRVQDAINEQHILLKNDPYRVDSYRALYKLHFDARQYDKAWCVASTLNFLRKADNEQRQFFEQYRPEGPIRPRNRLTNERWVKDLLHPDEDFLAAKVFEAVTPSLLRLRAQPDKKWQLNKKDLIPDVTNTTVAFARTFGFVTQVLSLPFVPRLFVCPDRQGGLAFALTQPPASVCGSALLSGQSPLDVIFVVAKHLTYYRGEHYIRTMFQTKDELKLILVAAMHIAGVEISDPHVVEWAKQIRGQMQPADVELLNSITKRFVESGARTDIKRWMQCVELTACRAGFLLANDIEIAARMIQAEPPLGAVDLTPKEKVEELILFSVSEAYFRLREALGIQIQVG
ncbi:MAG TPA: tetratricopeptide repeat protein [Polyangiales bacterium]|nr:tetratricopeptide repeat protein [Polyangiales bacterium]